MLRNYISKFFYQQLQKNLVEVFGIKTPTIARNLKFALSYLEYQSTMREVALVTQLIPKQENLALLTLEHSLLTLESSQDDLPRTREL